MANFIKLSTLLLTLISFIYASERVSNEEGNTDDLNLHGNSQGQSFQGESFQGENPQRNENTQESKPVDTQSKIVILILFFSACGLVYWYIIEVVPYNEVMSEDNTMDGQAEGKPLETIGLNNNPSDVIEKNTTLGDQGPVFEQKTPNEIS